MGTVWKQDCRKKKKKKTLDMLGRGAWPKTALCYLAIPAGMPCFLPMLLPCCFSLVHQAPRYPHFCVLYSCQFFYIFLHHYVHLTLPPFRYLHQGSKTHFVEYCSIKGVFFFNPLAGNCMATAWWTAASKW